MINLKYDIKGKNNYKGDILHNVLIERGIQDIDRFLNLTEDIVESPSLYSGMEEGFKLLDKHIKNESNIHIIIDVDADGVTSAALIYQYLKDLEKVYGKEINITYHMNEDKRHGIILGQRGFNLTKIDLLIVPDAGSNDLEACLKCQEQEVDVLILDHHIVEDKNAGELDNVVLINQHTSPDIQTKNIAGVGVTYKFCKFVDEKLGIDKADHYLDLVATGTIADIIDSRELETRFLMLKGLDQINNGLLKELMEKQSFFMNGEATPTTIGWSISPLINATVRAGKPKERRDMFRAFIGDPEIVEYKTKKGIEEQTLQKSMARICGNIKGRQDRAVKKSVEKVESIIKKEKLFNDKIIVVDITGALESSFTGLVANKLASKYQRPILLLRSRESNPNEFGGSGRNYHGFPIEDLNTYLCDTGYFIFCQGHDNAFGVGINKNNISDLRAHINKDLKHVEITTHHSVDFEVPFGELTDSMIQRIGLANSVWAKGVEEPVFAIKDVRINSRNIELRGDRMKTLVFNRRGIDFFKKFANEDYHDEFTMKPKKGFNVGRDLNFTIIGKLRYDEWNGKRYPKVEILDYNVFKETHITF